MNSSPGIIREIYENSDPKAIRDSAEVLSGIADLRSQLAQHAQMLHFSRLATVDFSPNDDGSPQYKLRWASDGTFHEHEGRVRTEGGHLTLVGLPASIKPLSLLTGNFLYTDHTLDYSTELPGEVPGEQVQRRRRDVRNEAWPADRVLAADDRVLAADDIESEGLELFEAESLALGAASKEETDQVSASWKGGEFNLRLMTDRILGERLPLKIVADYSENHVPKQILFFGDLIRKTPGTYEFAANDKSPVPCRPVLDNGCLATVQLSLRTINSKVTAELVNADPGMKEVSSYLNSRGFEIHIGGLRGEDGYFRNGASVPEAEHHQHVLRFSDSSEVEREASVPFDLRQQGEIQLQRVFDQLLIQIEDCVRIASVGRFFRAVEKEQSPTPSEHLLALAPMIISRKLIAADDCDFGDELDQEILAEHERVLAVFKTIVQSEALLDYVRDDYELGLVLQNITLHVDKLEEKTNQGPDALGKYVIKILRNEGKGVKRKESRWLTGSKSENQERKKRTRKLEEKFGIHEGEVGSLLQAFGQAKRLSAEEERSLASVIQSSGASKTDRQAALRSLVGANIRLAETIGRRHALITNLALDDLCQVAMLRLLKEAEKYKPNTIRFSTYASFWIRKAIDDYVLREERRKAKLQLDSDLATTDEDQRRVDPVAPEDAAREAAERRLDIGDASTYIEEFLQQQRASGRPEYELFAWQQKRADDGISDDKLAMTIEQEFPSEIAGKKLTGNKVNDICQKIRFAWRQFLVGKNPSVAKLNDWVDEFAHNEKMLGTDPRCTDAWSDHVLIGTNAEEAAKTAGLATSQMLTVFAELEARWNAFAVSKRLTESSETQTPLLSLDVLQRLKQRMAPKASRNPANPADQQIDVLIAAFYLMAEGTLAETDLDFVEAWLFRGKNASELSSLFQCNEAVVCVWQQRLARAIHCQILIDYNRFLKVARDWKKANGIPKEVRYADYSKRLVENWFLCKCDGFEAACERLESELTRTHKTKIKKLRSENLRMGNLADEGVQVDPPELDRDGCLKIITQVWTENETLLPRELLDVPELAVYEPRQLPAYLSK